LPRNGNDETANLDSVVEDSVAAKALLVSVDELDKVIGSRRHILRVFAFGMALDDSNHSEVHLGLCAAIQTNLFIAEVLSKLQRREVKEGELDSLLDFVHKIA